MVGRRDLRSKFCKYFKLTTEDFDIPKTSLLKSYEQKELLVHLPNPGSRREFVVH